MHLYARTRVLILMALIASLGVGCAKGGSTADPVASCGSKDLKSAWTAPNLSFSFSLVNLNLNTNQTLLITFSATGRKCSGTANMTGDLCAGSYTITGMTWTGTGGADPGCSSLNETGTYSKTDAGLKFTNTANQSTTYQ